MPAVLPASEQHPDSAARPTKPPPLQCRLRLRLDDLTHPATSKFVQLINAGKDLEEQAQNVVKLLYTHEPHRPGTRSVTFVLRDFDGIAYTTGTELDNDHKEIHFSLNYIKQIGGDARHEILGVLCHELVHCFQWDAEGTCPGGLIEGMADWVRLNAGLGAAHWQREADGEWDGGYQHTGYFLDYLEKRFGAGTVSRINAHLQKGPYNEAELFSSCCQKQTVKGLWKDYKAEVEKGTSPTPSKDAPKTLPTHPAK